MSQRFQISLPDNTFIWLKNKAKAELRSVNNYIVSLIDKEYKKDLKLKPKSQTQQK